MLALRWLIGKDLRILRRSPVLAALLILYPAIVAVLIGLALSRSPGMPRVAFLNEIPPSQATVTLGKTVIHTTSYEQRLFQAIDPVVVHSRAQAMADVRDGTTLAALIIPADLPRRLATADESAYVDVIYNGSAVNQSIVQTALESKLAQANAELATQLQRVADGYIDLLLSGGRLGFLGLSIDVLGLKASAQILHAVLQTLPAHSALRARIAPVASFAQVAVILVCAKLLFQVPMDGPMSALLSVTLLFVAANVTLGYTFSTLARTQMQAMQMTFFFFLPSILLSGFMFPFRGMPGWAQVIGEAIPLTHFLRAVRAVMLKGAGFAEIAPHAWPMALFWLVVATIALVRYRRTLD